VRAVEAWSWYAEAKQWQSGIAALVGFLGLILAALWNFRLNRRRDKQLREEEMVSVAVAIYGEILLLRDELALLARWVAHWEFENEGIQEIHQFMYMPSLPALYQALASKLGLFPADLLLGIVEFYSHLAGARRGFDIYCRTQKEPSRYAAGSLVLEDALGAVSGVNPALRRIEQLASIPEAKEPDTKIAQAFLEEERLKFEWAQAEREAELKR
jgi:hypothetical protein